jgi:hypothetical protein
MRPIVKALVGMALIAGLLPTAILAQDDDFGKTDTIYADIAFINELTATVTISMTNDENLVGLQIPFKMDAGLNKIVADSGVYAGGRVADAKWAYLGFRPDTAIQCVLLGMIADIGPTSHRLLPGRGRIATVFISSVEGKKIEKLAIDTTTVGRGVSLMAVADTFQGNDTLKIDMIARQIKPVWVVRYPK